jgi:hypothetical protein
MKHTRIGCGGALALATVFALAACDSGSSSKDSQASTTTTAATTSTLNPNASSALVHGTARLDGAPFDAKFIGAVVQHNGLRTACQATLPAIKRGTYRVEVLAETASAGCGAPDGQIVLWTFVDNKQLWSTTALPWPGDGHAAAFNAAFSSATPAGASTAVGTEFSGSVYDQNGEYVPAGSKVEARIGDAVCGVATVRKGDEFFGYIMSVSAPSAIPDCKRGGQITLQVDGRPVQESLRNLPRASNDAFDLTVS